MSGLRSTLVQDSYRPPAPFLALARAATARPRPPTPIGSFLACNSPLSCSAVFCILQATDAHVAPGLTLYLGSIRLNMGAFFSMSGMVMNLRQAAFDDDACLEDVIYALVGLRTAMTGNSLTSHCRP